MDHEAKLLNAAQRALLYGNAVNLRFACQSNQSSSGDSSGIEIGKYPSFIPPPFTQSA
jgi:hypothetical protein